MRQESWALRRRAPDEPAGLGIAGRVLLGLLIVSYAAFALSVFLRPSGEILLWADLGAYDATFALAAILMLMRGLRGDRSNRPWALIGAGLAFTAIGGVLWSLADVWALLDTIIPIPDILWLAFYPLTFIGLTKLGRKRLSLGREYATLDAVLVGSGTFTLGLVALSTVLAVDPADGVTASYVINASYLLGDLVLMAMLVMVAQSFEWRLPLAWSLLLAGLAVFAVGDAAYLVQVSNNSYVEGSAIDLLWPSACMLFGLAAVTARPLPHPDTPTSLHDHRSWVLVPSLAVLSSAAVLVAAALQLIKINPWLPEIFAGITVLLGVVRLDLALRSARSLAQQLRDSQVDPLTGLPNRRALSLLGPAGSLVVVNIDDMASFNHSLGAERADRLLLTIAQRVRSAVRDEDVVTRVGGDEFAVLMATTSGSSATSVAEGLLAVVEEPLDIDGLRLHITACAGVAAVDGARLLPASELLSEATEALRSAKSVGPGLVRSQDGSVSQRSRERVQRRAAVRAALEGEAIDVVPYFQPIVGIVDGDVLVCEALARWHHDGKVLTPDHFIDDVAQSASLPTLTHHMLQASLRAIDVAGLDYSVAVNVPPELVSDALVDDVRQALATTGVEPRRLVIEITETAILRDPREAADILHQLRALGVRVLLDDFGTGWSGLSSLRDLGIDGLKLDYSFVSRMATDPTTAAIVRGVASVADELGILVIYEGVEDPEVNAMVSALPSGYVQGFAVARPMPIADLASWARTHPSAVD